VDLLRGRARTTDELVRQAAPYFGESVTFDADAVAKQWKDVAATRHLLTGARAALSALTTWDTGAMETALRTLAETEGVGAGKVMQPLRVAVTGVAATPGMFDVLALIGRERTLARIDAALAHPHLAV